MEQLSLTILHVADAYRPQIEQMAQETFSIEGEEIVALVDKHHDAANAPDTTIQRMRAYYVAMGQDRWANSLRPILAEIDRQTEVEVDTAFATKQIDDGWLDSYTYDFARSLTDQSMRALSSLLRYSHRNGWAIPRLTDELEMLFGVWANPAVRPGDTPWAQERTPRYRATMIARTESIRAANMSALRRYEERGVRMKQWHATIDDRTCPFCMELDGKILNTTESYFNKGDQMTVFVEGTARRLNFNYQDVLTPPLHPLCRCCVLPYDPRWQPKPIWEDARRGRPRINYPRPENIRRFPYQRWGTTVVGTPHPEIFRIFLDEFSYLDTLLPGSILNMWLGTIAILGTALFTLGDHVLNLSEETFGLGSTFTPVRPTADHIFGAVIPAAVEGQNMGEAYVETDHFSTMLRPPETFQDDFVEWVNEEERNWGPSTHDTARFLENVFGNYTMWTDDPVSVSRLDQPDWNRILHALLLLYPLASEDEIKEELSEEYGVAWDEED